MRKLIISLLLITYISVPFMGCTKKSVSNNTKETSVQSTNMNNIKEPKLESKKSQLYELAFDAVWEIDKGLNTNIKYISINTKTFKDFSEEDRRQLFEYVADKYDAVMLDMSIDELKKEGYINDLNFKEGILFQVDKYNSYSSNSVSFEGMKWASGLGAIGFSFEGQNKNNMWELKKCSMTWIS
jgi:hypothetical protein